VSELMIDDKRAGRGVAYAMVGLTPLLVYQCENVFIHQRSKEEELWRYIYILSN
jgi:hypothetical protein